MYQDSFKPLRAIPPPTLSPGQSLVLHIRQPPATHSSLLYATSPALAITRLFLSSKSPHYKMYPTWFGETLCQWPAGLLVEADYAQIWHALVRASNSIPPGEDASKYLHQQVSTVLLDAKIPWTQAGSLATHLASEFLEKEGLPPASGAYDSAPAEDGEGSHPAPSGPGAVAGAQGTSSKPSRSGRTRGLVISAGNPVISWDAVSVEQASNYLGRVCRYYLQERGCMHGSECNWDHPEENSPTFKMLLYNHIWNPDQLPGLQEWLASRTPSMEEYDFDPDSPEDSDACPAERSDQLVSHASWSTVVRGRFVPEPPAGHAQPAGRRSIAGPQPPRLAEDSDSQAFAADIQGRLDRRRLLWSQPNAGPVGGGGMSYSAAAKQGAAEQSPSGRGRRAAQSGRHAPADFGDGITEAEMLRWFQLQQDENTKIPQLSEDVRAYCRAIGPAQRQYEAERKRSRELFAEYKRLGADPTTPSDRLALCKKAWIDASWKAARAIFTKRNPGMDPSAMATSKLPLVVDLMGLHEIEVFHFLSVLVRILQASARATGRVHYLHLFTHASSGMLSTRAPEQPQVMAKVRKAAARVLFDHGLYVKDNSAVGMPGLLSAKVLPPGTE
ncbi:hypothetical protein H696_06066 [Fonticula alba]|uniref:C3H1-type domain-containing protein n=1 Tax=Fonticula alba TaxID=691883 RepID=A0A058Z218_FONAL|nr:hypothetical protein H696_06066 [Fonticula alba]KCV67547.1 hypothetical protein H696_06066 [Fonticula alba]|eukprot:XP_009498108.1 hypothetical protein H696_06066 [Fonticula alba]